MNGILYGVSVGPGDPELLTLQAVRILRSCPVIAIPRSSVENERVAYEIAKRAVPELSLCEVIELYTPMTHDSKILKSAREAASERLVETLSTGKNIAFLTLGDVSIYSTFGHLADYVKKKGFTVKMVAGVPSFCAAAAALGEGLTDAHLPLHLLASSYAGWETGLDVPGTKILMKSGKSLPAVIRVLRERNLLHRAKLVQRCGMVGEQVFQSLENADYAPDYFSIIILKDGEEI